MVLTDLTLLHTMDTLTVSVGFQHQSMLLHILRYHGWCLSSYPMTMVLTNLCWIYTIDTWGTPMGGTNKSVDVLWTLLRLNGMNTAQTMGVFNWFMLLNI